MKVAYNCTEARNSPDSASFWPNHCVLTYVSSLSEYFIRSTYLGVVWCEVVNIFVYLSAF